MPVFIRFLQFQENVEGTKHCKPKCLATFGCRNAGIYAVFCPWRRQTLVNYSIFCTFWTDCLSWWTQKTLVFTCSSKNRRSWRERNPVNNSVLATFGGLKLWYLRGFLPSDHAKCCKLHHFVRCLRSIFKRAMLSHVLCILPQETTLQIETGRQRDPKESWREETHRSFYTHRGIYTEKSLHKGAFYTYTEKSLL